MPLPTTKAFAPGAHSPLSLIWKEAAMEMLAGLLILAPLPTGFADRLYELAHQPAHCKIGAERAKEVGIRKCWDPSACS